MDTRLPPPCSRRLRAAAAALLASAALGAQAHGPTPQKIDEQIEVAAPPAAVWALVGDFTRFAAWNPVLASSSADRGNTAGSKRTLTLARGGVLTEELDEHQDGEMSMSYRSGRDIDPAVLAVGSYSARLRVLPAGSGSRIEWRARAYRADTGNEPAEGRDDASAVAALQELMRPALAAARERLQTR
ncbi:MxaD protein [Rubrivivax gelatinosus]|uniref:SRPBCC family protein n=1 Tax=Rubrivivax gelatinosus TaxID=28068 RepID=UPI0019049009|nr:SRPBCC family protein [Rubrivivax gelatinosus]MBK1614333.1 MxaD protein [Rubrivivax gelatinosus]